MQLDFPGLNTKLRAIESSMFIISFVKHKKIPYLDKHIGWDHFLRVLIPANLKTRQVEMQLGKGYKASAKRVQTELEPVVTSGQQTKLNLR